MIFFPIFLKDAMRSDIKLQSEEFRSDQEFSTLAQRYSQLRNF